MLLLLAAAASFIFVNVNYVVIHFVYYVFRCWSNLRECDVTAAPTPPSPTVQIEQCQQNSGCKNRVLFSCWCYVNYSILN